MAYKLDGIRGALIHNFPLGTKTLSHSVKTPYKIFLS